MLNTTLKNTLFRSLLTLGLLVTVSAVQASAQTKDTVRFKIPFEFQVGDDKFAPGDYEIQMRVSQDPLLVKLHGVNNTSSIMFYTMAKITEREPEVSQLIFHRYGNQYFLRQVWRTGTSNQRELVTSRAEKELKKQGGQRGDYLALGVVSKAF